MAVIAWDNHPNWIWLLVLLDAGTLFLLMNLPFLLKELWQTSHFNRYLVFKNNQEELTLYRTKSSQCFDWQWIDKQLPNHCLVGFSGKWQQIENVFIFYGDDINKSNFKALLKDDELTVIEFGEFYEFFDGKIFKIVS